MPSVFAFILNAVFSLLAVNRSAIDPISVFAFTLNAVFSLLAVVSIALFVQEVVVRLQAGPVRFRLAIASAAVPWPRAPWSDPLRGLRLRGVAAYGWVRMFLLFGLLSIMFSIATRQELLAGYTLLISLLVCALSFRLTRRDAKRWLVLASGLFSLVVGAVVLAGGLRALQAGESSAYHMPRALILVSSAILFAIGAAVIEDSILGTRVHERGIQMFCTTQPWSRIVVRGWHACEGGFALHLSILPPQLFGIGLEVENEIMIPVPAPERPALEVFLTGHTATAR